MSATETKVRNVVEPIITNLNYKLYDVIYEKEGSDNYLRIVIDNDEGISINDCENVNNAIKDILDEEDIIKNQYMLEVSSPGLERRIRNDEHLEQALNKEIEVRTFKSGVITGTLVKYDDKTVTVQNEIENVIDKKNISKMKTVYNWED